MTEMLARNLSNKAVMGSDGTEVGTLHNVTTDLKTGQLRDLVIDPESGADDANFAFDRDEDGRYRVPANRIEAVKDYIVIRR